jgi:hypothetical protein
MMDGNSKVGNASMGEEDPSMTWLMVLLISGILHEVHNIKKKKVYRNCENIIFLYDSLANC